LDSQKPGQFLRTKPTLITMYRFVVLACAVASAAAVADPQVAYANGLAYGGAYTGFAAPYPYAAHGIAPAAYAAAAPVAAAPVAVAHAAPVAVAAAPVGLGLPEAATYALPPVRQVAEAPIVEQIVEPVEQWGYKVAY